MYKIVFQVFCNLSQIQAMECTKIMLQARDFSAGAKIRVYILKKKKWSVKNEEHQEQDIDVFCGEDS